MPRQLHARYAPTRCLTPDEQEVAQRAQGLALMAKHRKQDAFHAIAEFINWLRDAEIALGQKPNRMVRKANQVSPANFRWLLVRYVRETFQYSASAVELLGVHRHAHEDELGVLGATERLLELEFGGWVERAMSFTEYDLRRMSWFDFLLNQCEFENQTHFAEVGGADLLIYETKGRIPHLIWGRRVADISWSEYKTIEMLCENSDDPDVWLASGLLSIARDGRFTTILDRPRQANGLNRDYQRLAKIVNDAQRQLNAAIEVTSG